jgi:sec-independent protein translocase protein TatA
MGMPGWKELLIILLVVLVVFGAKKLRTIGSDLGAAVRGFRKSMGEGETSEDRKQLGSEVADAEFPENASSQRAGEKTDRNA